LQDELVQSMARDILGRCCPYALQPLRIAARPTD
jgi:hypothetical protein